MQCDLTSKLARALHRDKITRFWFHFENHFQESLAWIRKLLVYMAVTKTARDLQVMGRGREEEKRTGERKDNGNVYHQIQAIASRLLLHP